MRGYWNKPQATADVIDEQGWFHTGDIGVFDEGRIKITDRNKDIIVTAGGKNDQEVRDPAERLLAGDRRADADAEGEGNRPANGVVTA